MPSEWEKQLIEAARFNASKALGMTTALDTHAFANPFADLQKQLNAMRPPDYLAEFQKTSAAAQLRLATQARDLIKLVVPEALSSAAQIAAWRSKFTPATDTLSVIAQWRDSLRMSDQSRISDLLRTSTAAYLQLFGADAAALLRYTRNLQPPADNVDLEEVAEVLTQAADAAERQSATGPADVLTLEFVLSFLIALLICAYQVRLSGETERRLVERIAAVESSLTKKIDDSLRRESTFRDFAFAYRRTPLVASPRSRSVVAVLYPAVPCHVLDVRRKWIHLRYYDPAQNGFRDGWCLKKYVKLPVGYQAALETEYLLRSEPNAERLLGALERSRTRAIAEAQGNAAIADDER